MRHVFPAIRSSIEPLAPFTSPGGRQDRIGTASLSRERSRINVSIDGYLHVYVAPGTSSSHDSCMQAGCNEYVVRIIALCRRTQEPRYMYTSGSLGSWLAGRRLPVASDALLLLNRLVPRVNQEYACLGCQSTSSRNERHRGKQTVARFRKFIHNS